MAWLTWLIWFKIKFLGTDRGIGGDHWSGYSTSQTTLVDFALDLDKTNDKAMLNITGPGKLKKLFKMVNMV